MSRTQESGAYLGGIGAMLEGADLCPSCGEVHAPQYGFRHGGERGCPSVVAGHYPVYSAPPVSALPESIPAPIPLHVPEAAPESPTPTRISTAVPVALGSIPGRRREPEFRARTLGGFLLPPPDLGEVL
ncbi:MAG TPA: hypothetical protein VMG99_04125 [Thermoplasmata archaeon]|jgi:hypothetical protein|nr:hypothetical protein [Thermoplasmata archaeon]